MFAGWLGAAAPASRQLEDATYIGYAAFVVWIAAMGLAVLRRRELGRLQVAPLDE